MMRQLACALAREDEADLSARLRERVPGVRFLDHWGRSDGEHPEVRDIADAGGGQIAITADLFVGVPDHPGPGPAPPTWGLLVVNLVRSRLEPDLLRGGQILVGQHADYALPEPTAATTAFVKAVFAALRSVASVRLRYERSLEPIPGFGVGRHAAQWVRDDPAQRIIGAGGNGQFVGVPRDVPLPDVPRRRVADVW